jgi:hypothetical protein
MDIDQVKDLIREFRSLSGDALAAAEFLKMSGSIQKLAKCFRGVGAVAYLFCIWASFYVKLPPSQRSIVNAVGIQTALNTLAGVPIDIRTAVSIELFATQNQLVEHYEMKPEVIHAFNSMA